MTSAAVTNPGPRARLAAAEEELGPRRSLAPGRARATPLPALAEALELGRHPRDDGAARALGEVARAMARAFPGNLFADLDHLAWTLRDLARGSCDDGPVAALAAELVEVHETFGRPPLRFRYVHDFLYGFDWARWVARDPAQRAGHGPYGRVFVARMLRRGQEIAKLVEAGDRDYRPLRDGEFRNPFGFAREPEHEARLLGELARRGWIPVPAWDLQPALDWRRDYGALRRELAHSLGLSR